MMAISIFKYPNNIEDESFDTRRIVFMAIPGELKDVDKKWYRGQKGEAVSKDSHVDEMDVRCMITLPIPGSISDSQSHEWASESVLASSFTVGKKIIDKGIDAASRMTHGIIPDSENIGDIVEKSNSLATHLLGARKRVPNPGEFQTYNGSSLRSFSFSFDFIPENKTESQNIIDIITAFKTYSSPSTEDGYGVTMLSPFMWLISVTNGVINKLMNLKVCVCSQVSVDYGTDKFDIFEDGMPKKIKLSLSFSETELTYAENYNTGLETRSNASTTVLSASSGYANSFNEATSDNILSSEGGGVTDKGIEASKGVIKSMKEQYDGFMKSFDSWF